MYKASLGDLHCVFLIEFLLNMLLGVEGDPLWTLIIEIESPASVDGEFALDWTENTEIGLFTFVVDGELEKSREV